MANKYNNRRVEYRGMRFDSALERDRWIVLSEAQEKGLISGLQRQVEYELIPKQTRPVVVHLKTKDKIVQRCVERECRYFADFTYEKVDEYGVTVRVVEDTKGQGVRRTGRFFSTQTKDFTIKRKLMLWRFGVVLRIVTKAGEAI